MDIRHRLNRRGQKRTRKIDASVCLPEKAGFEDAVSDVGFDIEAVYGDYPRSRPDETTVASIV